MTVAEILIGLREAKGWSRYRLSAESGVDQTQLGRLERGLSTPSLGTLQALTRALGVSLAVFDGAVSSQPAASAPPDPQ